MVRWGTMGRGRFGGRVTVKCKIKGRRKAKN